MALDLNSVKFLLWAMNLGVSFDRTLTLGHLVFTCPPQKLRRAVKDFGLSCTKEDVDRCLRREPCRDLFCDEFLRLLGANEVTSVDYSNFEGATLTHDLNDPFPESLRNRFDLVLDGGTLEHVFHYPTALRHCMELLRPGGHFIAISPSNQWMGHGFYQFSPELFFRVFSAESGFDLRKMVVFDASRTDAIFYEVKDPAIVGGRVELRSSKPILLAMLAKRSRGSPVLVRPPQQSDYAAAWNKPKNEPGQINLMRKIRTAVNPYLPFWLRSWKVKLMYRLKNGPPTLNNSRFFRRLSLDEIAHER